MTLYGTNFKGSLVDENTVWPIGFDAKRAGAVTKDIPIEEDRLVTELQQRLRYVLSQLYTEPLEVRMVASDSGIDTSFINFQGSAQEIWENVLEEARLFQKIDQIMARAREDYGLNKEFQIIWDDYQKYHMKR